MKKAQTHKKHEMGKIDWTEERSQNVTSTGKEKRLNDPYFLEGGEDFFKFSVCRFHARTQFWKQNDAMNACENHELTAKKKKNDWKLLTLQLLERFMGLDSPKEWHNTSRINLLS